MVPDIRTPHQQRTGESTMAASFVQSPLFARGTRSTAVQLASVIMSQQEPDGEQHNCWSTVQYYGTVLRYSTTVQYYGAVLRYSTTVQYYGTVLRYSTTGSR